MPKTRRWKRDKRNRLPEKHGTRANVAVFSLGVSMLVLVPLAFLPTVYRVYVLPKFLLLMIGSSALVPLMLFDAMKARHHSSASLLKSNHVRLVCLYFLAISISVPFGVAPMSSLFGSVYNQMGLITQTCFFICFIGLIVGINASETRLKRALWAIAFAGFLVGLYAVAEFCGFDPFVPTSMYSLNPPDGSQLRVASTLGHSNYLGNFLLYTTPMSAGLALAAKGFPRKLALTLVLLSVAAIGCSGTRGAWVGLFAGAITFAILVLSGDIQDSDQGKKPDHRSQISTQLYYPDRPGLFGQFQPGLGFLCRACSLIYRDCRARIGRRSG